MARTKKQPPNSGVAVKGSFRLHIVDPDGTIAGDSGWQDNVIVAGGLQNYLATRLTGAGSSVTHISLGTGTVPAASTTGLPGELAGGTQRVAVGANASTSAADSSHAVAVINGTFASNAIVTGAGATLQNIGLFGHSSAATALFAGNTYATSPVASNQAVNISYSVSFSTS